MLGKVLIVDDEVSICETLGRVFMDEGFNYQIANDGLSALELLEQDVFALVLLDIWMPGLDGIETLKRIKERAPEVPVIMISGHATIATAMQATKIGAVDFIEKPLDLDAVLESVRRALSGAIALHKVSEEDSSVEKQSRSEEGDIADVKAEIEPIVFKEQRMRGSLLTQKTLAHNTLLYGQGLHSGTKSGLILEPLPPNSGIHFVGMSGGTAVPAHIDFVESTGFATVLKHGVTQVGTIEHLMAALCAYGISNLLIKCNDEVPVMDGSATDFCAIIDDTGVEEQEGEFYSIKISDVFQVGDEREFIRVEPGEGLVIDYTLDYPAPVGRQNFVFTLNSVEDFKKLVAPARTFGFVKDIGNLQKAGLAQGGRFDNFVLLGEEGVINSELRFPDEMARHKVLDAIGDLYLLGRPLEGKVTACMTGHSDNIALLRALKTKLRDNNIS